MLEKQKRDELLTGCFLKNEEVLINAQHLVLELQAKDHYEREIKRLGKIIYDLKNRIDVMRERENIIALNAPKYKRFEVLA